MPKKLEDLYHESIRIRRDLADLSLRVQQLCKGLADLAEPPPDDAMAVLARAMDIAICHEDYPTALAIRDLSASIRARNLQREMAKPKVREG